ncbi:unnamed protein product [Nippostrongylus brasiliensis]|uniref:DDE_3 domain-containing protein n=1 Tax=Nippostrongylus brasiliensis TaxID=27835 RepID=A0A0N4YD61_NIPBR|nr:unnamed protein product [Nippostrongylus brasiliensis]
MRQAHPAKLMVCAFITSDGKAPLFFVDSGARINTEIYLEDILKKHLLPWLTSHFGEESYVFQQDGAPAHKAKLVQKWCRSNLTDFVAAKDWPPNSPDLIPLDYSNWVVLEKKVCSTRHSSLDSLKAALVKAWDELDNDYLRRTVDAFPKRLRSCIRQEGGRIEQF